MVHDENHVSKTLGYWMGSAWYKHARPTNGHSDSMTTPQTANTHQSTLYDGVNTLQDSQSNGYPSDHCIGCLWHQILYNSMNIPQKIGNIPIKILRSVSSLPIWCQFLCIPFQIHCHLSNYKNRWALRFRRYKLTGTSTSNIGALCGSVRRNSLRQCRWKIHVCPKDQWCCCWIVLDISSSGWMR